MDFISVIIPAFNAERWLERTLRSVKDAIDEECEVIIVNDGSSDNTHDIARRYVDDDPRFTLIDIKHVGPCAARKAGFAESQGDYILFVDSDDVLPPDAITVQRDILDNASDTAESAKYGCHTDGRPKIVIANTLSRTGAVDKLLISGSRRALTGLEYAEEILSGDMPGFLPGHFIARELIEAIDWDDSPVITHQDNFYLLLSFAMKLNEWSPAARQVMVVPTVVAYNYMRRAGSQSALMALTPKGFERVWSHINRLGLPEPQLTIWGLRLIKNTFVDRGIPFPSSYGVASGLRKRALQLGDKLPDDLRELVGALGSLNKRTRIARHLARTAGLTAIRPHLTFVLVCHRNAWKVERSVASVFNMGLRNLEVILVDYDNPHSESVQLNTINIKYPRVRIIKNGPGMDAYEAAIEGLKAATGLSVAFMRPGDLCCANGLYEAVTRIDYGADAVLPNYRDYSPMTGLRWKMHSYAYLRSTEESRNASHTAANATEDIYPVLAKVLENPLINSTDLFIYGIVWRTEFLKDNIDTLYEMVRDESRTYSHAFLRRLLHNPLRIVTQDKTSNPSFEYARENFFRRIFLAPFKAKHKATGAPTVY